MLGERIEWVMEGKFSRIEIVPEKPEFVFLIADDIFFAFNISLGKTADLSEMVDLVSKLESIKDGKLKKFFDIPDRGLIYIESQKRFLLTNRYLRKTMNPDDCPFNAKEYEYEVLDLVATGVIFETVYFVGSRKFGTSKQEGLFSFPTVDLI